MQNRISIDPVSLSSNATNVLVTMPSFELGATEGTAYVSMFSEDDRILTSKRVDIPPTIYAQWKEDDNFIIDYVLQQLNVKRSTQTN
jgi:hypothetical protein